MNDLSRFETFKVARTARSSILSEVKWPMSLALLCVMGVAIMGNGVPIAEKAATSFAIDRLGEVKQELETLRATQAQLVKIIEGLKNKSSHVGSSQANNPPIHIAGTNKHPLYIEVSGLSK